MVASGRVWRRGGVGVTLIEGFDGAAYREDGDLHIVENGRGQRPRVLNAATAYLEGFFSR